MAKSEKALVLFGSKMRATHLDGEVVQWELERGPFSFRVIRFAAETGPKPYRAVIEVGGIADYFDRSTLRAALRRLEAERNKLLGCLVDR